MINYHIENDLSVDENYQKKGIGVALIKFTKNETPDARLILLAAPAAVHYYPKIGMTHFENCFSIMNNNELK